jgi:ParB/RepB/Spo0J family partition protein
VNVEGNQTQQTEIVSLNALYRSGQSLMQLGKAPEDGQVVLIELDRLKKGRFQKRGPITADSVRSLAESIRPIGLINNVIVRPDGDGFELIGGHRRTEAYRLLRDEAKTPEERAKWERVPCKVRMGLTDLQISTIAAVDNLERNDGTPLEQGLSLLEVKRVGGFTNAPPVAEATGMSAQRVARLLRLAEAPEIIQQAVTPGLMVEITDGEGTVRKERRKMDLTVALVAYGYYWHYARAEDAERAMERTEKLLVRALKASWTRNKLEAEVKRLLGARSQAEHSEPEDATEPTDPGAEQQGEGTAAKRLLFRDKGVMFTFYRRNLARAELTELHALMVRLRAVAGEVEAQIAALEAKSHQ